MLWRFPTKPFDGKHRAGNSAGITRYRTRQGWISEAVRGSGSGRQPIAEIIAVGLAVRDMNETGWEGGGATDKFVFFFLLPRSYLTMF